MNRKTSTLSPHPDNLRIYGDDLDVSLIDSIRVKGVLSPLLITEDGVIISGHRRWRAAKVAKLDVIPVTIFGSNDQLDILDALIESNRQRVKTNEQIGREAKVLLDIERERAKRRKEAGINLRENFPEGNGRSRDIVGAKLGISGKGVEQAARTVDVIDRLRGEGRSAEADNIVAKLNRSISRAYADHHEPKVDETASATTAAIAPKSYSVEEWESLSDQDRVTALNEPARGSFNRQDTDSIEWASWSWNPVTGCLHNCPYCYARDIAERFYPQKFAPTFHPSRLRIPAAVTPPDSAKTNLGDRNVFTCSMADLFGRWVPEEWIVAVLDAVRAAPAWNFLFLTKFPNRLAEFDFPANAWVGTSVDCQARVAAAESAFRKVNATVKWLSCEPLIEPLKFSSLEMFDWIVIGGASASTQTPEYRPPREWISDLEAEARRCGVRIYEKTNLIERLRDYPGSPDRHIKTKPEELEYLPSKVSVTGR
jgi:protein gp37/ParB-like chromosome segregation protein Spo0J